MVTVLTACTWHIYVGEVLVRGELDLIAAGIAQAIPHDGKRYVAAFAGVGTDNIAVGRRVKVYTYLGVAVLECPDGAVYAFTNVVGFAVDGKEPGVGIGGQAAAHLQCLGLHDEPHTCFFEAPADVAPFLLADLAAELHDRHQAAGHAAVPTLTNTVLGTLIITIVAAIPGVEAGVENSAGVGSGHGVAGSIVHNDSGVV